jgi:hypothetical protein
MTDQLYASLLYNSPTPGALGSAVERFPDKKEVDGPTPSAPTMTSIEDLAAREIFHLNLDGVRQAAANTKRAKPRGRILFEDLLVSAVINAFTDGVPKKLVETEIEAGEKGFGIE